MWFTVADFVISSGDYIRPYRSPWGSHPIRFAPEAASQSYLYGDVLQNTSSGQVNRASTTGSTCNSTAIVGVASQPASSVEGTRREFYEANPNVEFWARTRGELTQSSCLFKAYGLFRDSSKNVWLVDLGNAQSTSERVIITELIDSTGSSGGAVAFKFGSYNSTLQAFHGRSMI